MKYEMRPLGPWTELITADRAPASRFSAPWIATLHLLGRETGLLGAQLVVLQVDVKEGDIRRDGMLRVNARVGFPGVRVAFDSVHGALTYATDAYDSWQANIRAVALALESLRAVDRYGVSGRGEQYTGWRAIEAGTSTTSPFATADEAADWLAEQASGGVPGASGARILVDEEWRRKVLHAVVMRHHPDRGGARADWDRYEAARQLVEAAAR